MKDRNTKIDSGKSIMPRYKLCVFGRWSGSSLSSKVSKYLGCPDASALWLIRLPSI
jgi:hypothetical protein